MVDRGLSAGIHELLVSSEFLVEREDGPLAFLTGEGVSHASSASSVLLGWGRRRDGTTRCRTSSVVADGEFLNLVALEVSGTSSSRAKVCGASASGSRGVRLVDEVAQ